MIRLLTYVAAFTLGYLTARVASVLLGIPDGGERP